MWRARARCVVIDFDLPANEIRLMRYVLLLIPCLAVLIPAIYNSQEPRLFGMPFFWWYQLAMIPASAVFIFLVYRADRR